MVLPAAVVSLIIIVFETILRLMRPIVLLLVTHEFFIQIFEAWKIEILSNIKYRFSLASRAGVATTGSTHMLLLVYVVVFLNFCLFYLY